MADATYAQSNFSAGEFSPAYQGRVDDQEYKAGLALCLNYIPSQEGSLRPRSGLMRCGNTKANEPAKLLPFRFTATAPHVAEFTDGNMRLWSNGLPIFDTAFAQVHSNTGDPPIFTLYDQTNNALGIPAGWEDGCSIMVKFFNSTDLEGAPHLANREFTLNIVSTTLATVTLTDAVTGSPLTGAINFGGSFPYFYRVLDLPTKYQHPEGVRQVEFTDQVATMVPGTNELNFSPPDHRVTYLYPVVSPQSLSYFESISPSATDPSQRVNSNLALIAESFVDGPYFDSPSTTTPLVVNGTTGSITAILHQWDTRIIYNKGDLVCDYTQDPSDDPYYYMSLTDGNVGNALPADAAAGSVNANWLQINVQRKHWISGTSYGVGQAVTNGHYDGSFAPVNELPIYYSKIASNSGHSPPTSPLDWDTTPPNWDVLVAYVAGAVVIYTDGNQYVATTNTIAGTAPGSAPWVLLPITIEQAVTTITDMNSGWLGQTLFHVDDAGGTGSTLGIHFGTDNPGRLIRLKWSPQPWSNKTTYATGDAVNYNDVIFHSLTNSNLGNIPDQDAVNWEIQTTTINWTWGRITDAATHQFQCNIEILGPDLPSSLPIWEFRLGVFSDTTGWPTCAAYHEGRLALAGPTPNRVDLGCPDQGFAFAPTAPDGTVSDGNGIAITLNSREAEQVQALSSITEGIMIFTSEAEWLLSASAVNDPITPTSAQVHRTTAWSAHPNETERLPSALAAIQKGGRRVLEYRTFVDMTSYQSRLNAVDLTRRCQHLTVGGVGQTQYQSLSQPVLWASGATRLTMTWKPEYRSICAIAIQTPTVAVVQPASGLFGIGYMRAPDLSYAAPFSFEHGLSLSSGVTQQISSIAVQRAWQEGNENLYTVMNDPNDLLYYVEAMAPLFESTPLATTYFDDGTVNTYGTLASAYFLDSGVTPVGCKVASNGLSVTFYGMWPHVGKTVSFTIMGKYVGDYLIAADGSAVVTFNANFAIQDIGDAMNRNPGYVSANLAPPGANELVTPAYFNQFQLDANGNTIITFGGTTTSGGSSEGFYGQFGYKFRRRGKMLRPQVGGQNGPTFAKTVRADKAGIYLDAGQEVSMGTTFDNLTPLKLSKDGTRDVRALGAGDFVTGIFRMQNKGTYDFDGQICWEQTKPVPGAVLAVGGFDVVVDQ